VAPPTLDRHEIDRPRDPEPHERGGIRGVSATAVRAKPGSGLKPND
jgi:hypothetical protein